MKRVSVDGVERDVSTDVLFGNLYEIGGKTYVPQKFNGRSFELREVDAASDDWGRATENNCPYCHGERREWPPKVVQCGKCGGIYYCERNGNGYSSKGNMAPHITKAD